MENEEYTFGLSSKNIFKLSNVGSQCWFILHYLGFKQDTKLLHIFFNTLSKHFICPKCRRHLSQYLIDNYNKPPTTFEDTIILHNNVNQRINKPFFTDVYHLKQFFKGNLNVFVFNDNPDQLSLSGFLYAILLVYYFNGKEITIEFIESLNFLTYPILKACNDSFDINHFYIKLCDLNITDKNIFIEKNKGKIMKEISNQDYKPFKID